MGALTRERLLSRKLGILALFGAGLGALVSCGAPKSATSSGPAGRTALSAEMGSFSDSTGISGILDFLASDALAGRATGSEGLEQAAAFLESRLAEYGVKPYFATYRDTLSNLAETAYNIVGYIPGNDPGLRDQTLLLGAHYDHIGQLPGTDGDRIANGANDNASGTATLLEMARYFGANPPARSLMIVFFSAEERGLLGSKHLAARLREGGFPLYAMLNFEMTGVPMRDKDYLVYITGFDKSNLAEVSNRYGGEGLVGFLPQAAEFNLFQRSDNYPFYEAFRVPAHTYSSFDFTNYPYYHQPQDEASQLDAGHMARLVNRLLPAVRGVANAPEKELILR